MNHRDPAGGAFDQHFADLNRLLPDARRDHSGHLDHYAVDREVCDVHHGAGHIQVSGHASHVVTRSRTPVGTVLALIVTIVEIVLEK